jgi:4-hydroxy-2-oxoheptanedioate aldolase
MTERLNSVIKALESGKAAFTTFAQPDMGSVTPLATSNYDGLVFELEHNPWDIRELQIGLQFLLNRAQIVKSGSIAPNVTPIVRVPANGLEMNQAYAKQALDLGVYGIVWPHISTVEQARNAVSACRYPRLPAAPLYDPPGIRGDGPTKAARYWGLSQQEYYKKADVWPLNPEGEIFCILMIEDVTGIENLNDILTQVPGISAVLIGEGDLSQELGVARQYDSPALLEQMARVVETCKSHNVVVGHPHVNGGNVERILSEGYTFLMAAPVLSFAALDKGRELAGRT